MASLAGSFAAEGLSLYGGGQRRSSGAWAGGSDADAIERAARRDVRIGLCIPLGGLTGIWGPSALASAKLAVAELNRASGVGGRTCRLITIDADDHAPHVESTLSALVSAGEVDALVGMHTSYVRQRILSAVGGEIPYVYTPLYEGGEATPGVFAIGETPSRQLQPAITWLARNEKPRRWALLGQRTTSGRMCRTVLRAAI